MGEETEQAVSRRGFLRWFWRGLALLLAGEGTYMGFRLLTSRQPASAAIQVVTAGLASDFPPGTVTAFDAARFFMIRTQTGGLLALSSKCTHLGCVVGWQKDQHVFACPCHGSVFNQDGSVAHPPATRPLDYFPIGIGDDGRIQVDTRNPIARSAVSGSEPVYPPTQAAPSTAEATAAP